MTAVATIVAFHAHPDDEVLFTGGTLAWLAAEGHRVVIVVACAGGLGTGMNANPEARLAELRESASRLGAARVAHLGYADSGHGPVLFPDPPGQVRFARASLDEAAARLAALIREEHADVLLSYDPQGGNGHRDHVQVHQVGPRAAELAAPIRVLEATWPREKIARLAALLRVLRLHAGHQPRRYAHFVPARERPSRIALTYAALRRRSRRRWPRTGLRSPAGTAAANCSGC